MDRKAGKPVLFFLAAACAAAFLIPLFRLFSFGEYFFCNTLDPRLQKEWKELLFLALLSGPVIFLLKDNRWKLLVLSGIALVFSYLHVNLLPMIAGGCYLLLLSLSGSFIRGAGAVILTECLLSLCKLGSIANLRIAVLLLGAIAIFVRFWKEELRIPEELFRRPMTPLENTVLFTVFLVFLTQIGRMNGTLDFDSLWYGLRSEYILAPGGGIYENTGLLGLPYTYSKGAEVLSLPLSGFRSHSYVLSFHTWVFLYGLYHVYRLTSLFTGKKTALFSVLLTATVPGIVNMCVSAKPDMITWALQIVMLESCFTFLKERDGKMLLRTVSAFLLSLSMKPTAVVFSTALFGMMAVFLLLFEREKFRNLKIPRGELVTAAVSLFALAGIWGRTLLFTGLPFTSVFSGVLTRFGFRVKYPFPVSALPENYQDKPAIFVLAERVFRMLLSPLGDDMSHVIIAWGGSIFFVIVCVLAVTAFRNARRKPSSLTRALFWVTVPFMIVNLAALSMLYQVDGNYFMTLYSVLILLFCLAFSGEPWTAAGKARWYFLVPLIAFQFLLMTASNWASVPGFTEFTLNRGSYHHKAYEKEYFQAKGAGEVWDLLEAEPEARVIAFADHPDCLSLPCIVQSFDDTFDSWGNKDVVYSARTYAKYLQFAEVDYLYLDPSYFDPEWHRRARLIFEGLTEAGLLREVPGTAGKLYRVGEG